MNVEEKQKVIEKEYFNRIHESINWKTPQKYTEIIQWRKLFYKDKRMTNYSDKILVREYVKDTIGEQYLIPILGEWQSFSEIDFNSLPSSFVLKTNHGSGTNIIVKNKTELNYKTAKTLIDGWMSIDYGYRYGLELHYSEIDRRIYAEKYIDLSNSSVEDYKFLCFDGKAHYCWVDVDRGESHRRNIYNLEWELQPWGQEKKNTDNQIPKPQNFDLMVTLAEKLASEFSHVRVDFYNINGQIYFGEMTFTNGSGYDLIYPRKYDWELGKLWKNYKNS